VRSGAEVWWNGGNGKAGNANEHEKASSLCNDLIRRFRWSPTPKKQALKTKYLHKSNHQEKHLPEAAATLSQSLGVSNK